MKAWFKAFWKKHIVDNFPYEDECFDCNLLTCGGCKLRESPEAVRTKTVELVSSCISIIIFMVIIVLLFDAIGG